MVTTLIHGALLTTGDVSTIQETYAKPQEAKELASAKAFLLTRPRGVYTCGRAVPAGKSNAYHLVLWDFHLTRLANGLQHEMKGKQLDKSTVDLLRTTTTCLLTLTLKDAAETSNAHAMVTALWSVDGTTIRVDVHVCPMPQVKTATSNVLVYGEARTDAECKHSRWITERIPLEDHQQAVAAPIGINLHETILSVTAENDDHVLLEGLITNFFVVKNGSIYTAPTNVLAGSTRELVLRACAFLNIPVVLEAPRLSEIASWDAAFLTSAVRIVVPVAMVLWYPSNDVNDAIQSHTLDINANVQLLDRIRTQICDVWQSV